MSVVRDQAGRLKAGLASSPSAAIVAGQTAFQPGHNRPPVAEAAALAGLVQSRHPVEVAVGLATLNALLEPDPANLSALDAVDWLARYGRERNIALVGRFPFIAELQPLAAQLWVLELAPKPGEYGPEQAPEIIPQADVVAITSSSLINGSLPQLLRLVADRAKVMLLGPSTPLSPALFQYQIDVLSGVQVIDIEAVWQAASAGLTFQKLVGVRRVTLEKGHR